MARRCSEYEPRTEQLEAMYLERQQLHEQVLRVHEALDKKHKENLLKWQAVAEASAAHVLSGCPGVMVNKQLQDYCEADAASGEVLQPIMEM